MIATTVAAIAGATGASRHGRVDADAVVTRVVTDSRLARSGDLFVAIAGEHHDGHDHAAAAVAAGAVAVLGTRAVADLPVLVVADPLDALARLAREVLSRLQSAGSLEVVGVTGSVGKTGTKDLLGHLLGALGPTVAPQGSFNNELGLPLTVLRCEPQTRYLVLELGARGLGQIRALTRVAPPRVGVVLGVGSAHLGEFGSTAAIAQAKGELVEALDSDGVAVLNADDPLVLAMRSRTTAAVRTFGLSPDADLRASDVTLDACARPTFRLHLAGGSELVTLRLHGEHTVLHALAAAAVADVLGMPFAAIVDGLTTATAVSGARMQVSRSPDGVTVVNDAYNASPESVASALRSLAVMGGADETGVTRRTWAVLGQMRELGESSTEEHARVGRLAVHLGVSRLVTVGPGAAPIHQAALDEGFQEAVLVPDVAAAIALLRPRLRTGDVVLVKASRAAGLDLVAAALLDANPGTTGPGAGDRAGGPA